MDTQRRDFLVTLASVSAVGGATPAALGAGAAEPGAGGRPRGGSGGDRTRIRRRFADLDFGQVLYREAGTGPVLLLLHASPGSSKQLEPLIGRLAQAFRVISPDTPGNGDSAPLPLEQPRSEDYAGAMLQLLDALEIPQAHVYGTHTGACIGSELALLAPDRVGRLIQDGVAIFTRAEREELLARYAHPFEPDLEGAHLLRAFMFCRDQYVFFPWYARDRAHLRQVSLPAPRVLHDWVVEVLKAATTYHLAYRAAFAYPAEERLPLVTQPVLCVAAEDDPLRAVTVEIAPKLADGRFEGLPRFDAPDYLEALAGAITGFVRG